MQQEPHAFLKSGRELFFKYQQEKRAFRGTFLYVFGTSNACSRKSMHSGEIFFNVFGDSHAVIHFIMGTRGDISRLFILLKGGNFIVIQKSLELLGSTVASSP